MAKFHVGQRVKVISVHQAFECLNREATILGFDERGYDDISGNYEGYDVYVDGVGAISPQGLQYCFLEDQLRPLTPPHEPGSWRVLDKLLPNLRGMHA